MGQLVRQKNDILDCVEIISDVIGKNIKIVNPLTGDNKYYNDLNLITKQLKYIDFISKSDNIILIRKPNGEIGESTSYELAMAMYFKKNILEYDNTLKQLKKLEYDVSVDIAV